MLKEVGASGQISLGKKYAGQLFDLQTQADGSIVMRHVKVVPATLSVQEEPARYAHPALTAPNQPSQTSLPTNPATAEWVQQHAEQITQYNTWATQREPYSQRVRRWRTEGV